MKSHLFSLDGAHVFGGELGPEWEPRHLETRLAHADALHRLRLRLSSQIFVAALLPHAKPLMEFEHAKKMITLTPPQEHEALLKTMLTMDDKVDQLLPLLDLLNDPDHPMSELGQALIEALQRIADDLRKATKLRDEHRAALDQANETNVALSQMLKDISQELQDIRAETRSLKQQISEIHGLMFSPVD